MAESAAHLVDTVADRGRVVGTVRPRGGPHAAAGSLQHPLPLYGPGPGGHAGGVVVVKAVRQALIGLTVGA